MDQIHDRYVLYSKQTQTQRDSTKTEFTYAKSFSYRSLSKCGQWQWFVPNMCRTSLAFVANTLVTKSAITDSPIDSFNKSDIYSKLILNKRFGQIFIPLLDIEHNENMINKLKDKQRLEGFRSVGQKLTSISILFAILASLLWISSQYISGFELKRYLCEKPSDVMIPKFTIDELIKDIKQIKVDLQTLKESHKELVNKIDMNLLLRKEYIKSNKVEKDVSVKQSDGNEINEQTSDLNNNKDISSSIQYFSNRCNKEMRDLKPTLGIIELMSILKVSNDGQNDFSCLYRFTPKP